MQGPAPVCRQLMWFETAGSHRVSLSHNPIMAHILHKMDDYLQHAVELAGERR